MRLIIIGLLFFWGSNIYAAGAGLALGTALMEAVKNGGDLAQSIGCAAGGIKAEELTVLNEVITDGDITLDEEAKLNQALTSGLCIEGEARIENDIRTGKIKLGKGACVSQGTTGFGGC